MFVFIYVSSVGNKITFIIKENHREGLEYVFTIKVPNRNNTDGLSYIWFLTVYSVYRANGRFLNT